MTLHMVAELGTSKYCNVMNAPNLPGMQTARPVKTVGRGRNQGLYGGSPMSLNRIEAGCAGVFNNVPIPPSYIVREGLLERVRRL